MDYMMQIQYTGHIIRGMFEGFTPLTRDQFIGLVTKIEAETTK